MNCKKIIAGALLAGLLLTGTPVLAEAGAQASIEDSQRLDATYTLAINAINAEDYATARQYLDICFAYCDPKSDPEMYADLLLKQACINVIEGQTDMALLQLDACLRIQPELANAYLVRTEIYSGLGDVDRAVENLEKYIELTNDTSLYQTVAQLQENGGNLEAAQAAYDKYVEGAGGEVAEAGFQSGLYKMEAGRFEEAIADFEAYLEDETFASGALYNIGVCRMNMGDHAAAIEAFDGCLEKGGQYDGLYYNRGVCHMMNGDLTGAIADFKQSVESGAYVADANFYIGLCEMQNNNYASAVAVFTELIDDEALQVSDAVYYYRGVCRAADGDLEGALEDYTRCIDDGYELSQTYYQRAQVYAALGDVEKQNSDLRESLKNA